MLYPENPTAIWSPIRRRTSARGRRACSDLWKMIIILERTPSAKTRSWSRPLPESLHWHCVNLSRLPGRMNSFALYYNAS